MGQDYDQGHRSRRDLGRGTLRKPTGGERPVTVADTADGGGHSSTHCMRDWSRQPIDS